MFDNEYDINFDHNDDFDYTGVSKSSKEGNEVFRRLEKRMKDWENRKL